MADNRALVPPGFALCHSLDDGVVVMPATEDEDV
jgi:hypothetical protein